MSNIKKGILTRAKVWNVHLRKFWKRNFWKGERKAGKQFIRKEINE